jgi:hypothetical protein
MRRSSLSILVVAVVAAAAPSVAGAQTEGQEPEAQLGAEVQADGEVAPPPDGENPYGQPPIPPQLEQAPVAGAGGGYCYAGPHPVDPRSAGGPQWDDTAGVHTHFYPPFDARLFALHDGCYYFVGDPTDFGYTGQTYGYYGAHPLLDAYGGGWCFMIGGHSHAFLPWSSGFVVVGPWYYWQGLYDAYFWNYWPYYSYYYRAYYPRYYAGGRFYRDGGYRVAPPIRSVPGAYAARPGGGWRGNTPSYAGNGWRAGAPTPGGARSSPVGPGWHSSLPVSPPVEPGGRGGWSAPTGGWGGPRYAVPTAGSNRPATAAPSAGWGQPATPAQPGGWSRPAPAPVHVAPSHGGGWSGGHPTGGAVHRR